MKSSKSPAPRRPPKSSAARRPPASAAAKARVAALLRGEAPIVDDPAEAQGLAFVSPAERHAAVAREARKRALAKKRRGK